MPVRLRRKRISSFAYLNIAQFCGALNDNLFKLVIVFMLVELQGADNVNVILAISGAVFIAPFLLFSLMGGTLSDRFSKRNIIVIIKAVEVVVMLFGILAFSLRTAWGSYLVLFFMATQSALFGPSKYGIVPELVEPARIARANGILTGLTVIATILGSFLASVLTQLTDSNFPLIAGFTVLIAVIGLAGALGIGYTPPAGTTRKISVRLISQVVRVLKRTRKENYLFAALWGSSFFFLVGAYIQLNILPFAIQSLGLTSVQGNYIFAVAAVGIAVGAYLSGRLQGDDVEIGLSPLFGLTIFFLLVILFLIQHYLWAVVAGMFVLGVFGGAYLVPFDAYIQVASPERHRGENVAAGNFLSFVGVAVAVFLLFVFADLLHLSAALGFLGIGILAFIVAVSLAKRLSDTFVRLVSHYRFRGKHQLITEGRELLPKESPSLFLRADPDWAKSLNVMTIAQGRYMKFALQRPASMSSRENWLCRFAKVEFFERLPTDSPEGIKRWLDRGFSVTILYLREEDQEKMEQASRHLVEGTDIPIIQAQLTFDELDRPNLLLAKAAARTHT